MAQAVQMRAPAHYLRVSLDDPAECEYWLVVLDVGAADLRRAVDAAGPELWNVRAWLQARRPGPHAAEAGHPMAFPAP